MSVIRHIQDQVCVMYGITRKQMLSPSRKPEFAQPRHYAMYLCFQCGYSKSMIARWFDRKCHTTVINAIMRIEERIKEGDIFHHE